MASCLVEQPVGVLAAGLDAFELAVGEHLVDLGPPLLPLHALPPAV